MRLNSNQTRTRMISGNHTRCSTRFARSATRVITTNRPRTRLITITNHTDHLFHLSDRQVNTHRYMTPTHQ